MTQKFPPISLTIMSKEYKIACEPEERDTLVRSAHQLDEQMRKMRDSGKISGPERIAVMAALNLAHELEMAKNQNALLNQQLAECLDHMKNKIENVLENHQTG
jgi:cell division protein ZapA